MCFLWRGGATLRAGGAPCGGVGGGGVVTLWAKGWPSGVPGRLHVRRETREYGLWSTYRAAGEGARAGSFSVTRFTSRWCPFLLRCLYVRAEVLRHAVRRWWQRRRGRWKQRRRRWCWCQRWRRRERRRQRQC